MEDPNAPWIRIVALALALTLTLGCATTRAQEPNAREPATADALQREFDLALRAWSRAYAEAIRAKDTQSAERLRAERPERRFAERFANVAARFEKREAAVPYLVWIVQRGPAEMATRAMTTLMQDHPASPAIRLAVARIGGLKQTFGLERSRAWLDRVLDVAEDPLVQAQARFTRAGLYVGTRAMATSAPRRALAITDLERAATILDTLEQPAPSLSRLVADLLDEAKRLEPGLPAPEIEGKDTNGIAFKLSDYRGKVVLLDFWGDW
ncbi:MAG: hypothetical protein KDC95_18210 [Planctomycetes bacterium]|nr:hypothetical protein [Planctomycetota bacterium]